MAVGVRWRHTRQGKACSPTIGQGSSRDSPVIAPGDLEGAAKLALERAGFTGVSFVEPDLERPFLEVLTGGSAGLRIRIFVEEEGPSILCLETLILTGLRPKDDSTRGAPGLEFVLRTLNELNRRPGTPWKLWLKGMKVEFEGVLTDQVHGEVWATWSMPTETVSIDDLSGLVGLFSDRLEAVEIPGMMEILEPLLT